MATGEFDIYLSVDENSDSEDSITYDNEDNVSSDDNNSLEDSSDEGSPHAAKKSRAGAQGSDSDSSDSSGGSETFSSNSPSPPRSPVKQRVNQLKNKRLLANKLTIASGKKMENKSLSAAGLGGKRAVSKQTFPHKTQVKAKKSEQSKAKAEAARHSEAKGQILEPTNKGKNLHVPPIKLLKSQKHPAGKLPPVSSLTSVTPPSSSSSTVTPTTTSILLSMMAQAVSAPKYTSVHTSASPTSSDFPDCPTRSSWPLLREMIATPSVASVSISPAPRQSLSTVFVDPAKEEEPKQNVINKLEKEIKCLCKFNKGEPCWLLFNEERLRKERLHHLTLKRESLDLVVLAKIAANINREEKTKKRHGKDRQRCRLCYFHEGRQICRETFLFIHGICKGRLSALMKHYKQQGLSVRVHGNKSNVPKHALSSSDSERVLDFIRDYANKHCVSSFGRKPGSKAGGGLLIMSPSQSKIYVHHKYKIWCRKNNFRTVSMRSFQILWTKHLPYIVVLRGSNKTPVPEPGSREAIMEMQEDADEANETTSMSSDGTRTLVSAPGYRRHLHGVLRVPQSLTENMTGQLPTGISTQVDFDASEEDRKKRKRKVLPPRRVDPLSCQSSSVLDVELSHSRLFDQSQPSVHSADGNVRNNTVSSNHNNTENLTHSPPTPTDVHHSSLFNSDLHIPSSSSSTTSLHHHPHYPSTAISLNSRGAPPPMMLTNKDTLTSYHNKSPVSVMKTSNLRSTLYLPQPSQLLESYSMHCSERYATPISASHALTDQSQPVLLPHQSSDFANMHQIDWQAWQPYSAL